jgi:DNA-binding NtrC family response regulator
MKAPNAKRVLFVDDEEGVRKSWSRYLSEEGFDVATAEDGERAIAALKDKPVDVVVSDLRMPGFDGLVLLERMRQSRPDTPFILLTGYGNEDVERKARELGVFRFLNKPIRPETLSAVLTAALQLGLAPKVAEPAPAAAVAEPATRTAPAAMEAVGEAAALPAVAEPRSQAVTALKVVAGVAAAPLLGLAFVIFMPVLGFVALFKVAFEAIRGGPREEVG